VQQIWGHSHCTAVVVHSMAHSPTSIWYS